MVRKVAFISHLVKAVRLVVLHTGSGSGWVRGADLVSE